MRLIEDNKIIFSNLDVGEFFAYDGILYLKISDDMADDKRYNCFNLYSNEATNISIITEVEKRDGEIHIRN